MKRIVFLLLCCLTLTSYAQQRLVKVTTYKGSVYKGTLEKFKAFEYVVINTEGKSIMIPYNEMAYIDDILPVETAPVVEEAAPIVEETIPITEETTIVDVDEVPEAKTPTKTPVKASPKALVKPSPKKPVKTSTKAPVKTSTKTPVKTSIKTPVKTPTKALPKTPAKKWVPCSACSHNPGVCQTCFGVGNTVDGQTCMSCHGTRKCHLCGGKGGHYKP